MFDNLKADLQRNLQDYKPCGKLKTIALALSLNSTQAILLIRFQQWCARKGLPTFFAAKLLFWLFKIEVSRHALIGRGLRLPHPMGIIIAPNATVGENCDLYADVRLVWAHGIKQGPRIGNNVFLGDGAKVLGGVSIGDHAIIGVSTVVTKNIPPHATAIGIPVQVANTNNGREAAFLSENPMLQTAATRSTPSACADPINYTQRS